MIILVIVVLVVVSASYFATSQFNPVRLEVGSALIYPVQVVYANTVLIVGAVIVLVGMFTCWTVLRGAQLTNRERVLIVGGVLVAGALYTLVDPAVGGAVFVLTVLAALWLATGSAFRRFAPAGLLVVAAALMTEQMMQNALRSFQPMQRVEIGEQTFLLTFVRDSDVECDNRYLVVYECDAAGVLCHVRYASDNFYACMGDFKRDMPTQVTLTARSKPPRIELRMDDTMVEVDVGGAED